MFPLGTHTPTTQGKRPRLLYTIPTGQNPSGTTLSDERRVSLYALACKHDLIILEDDPYVVGWSMFLRVFCVV
jgi:DNA-binding transcriptional MocR family regulator